MEKEKAKRPDVNAASLIDLKAELFRKQEQFKKQKLQANGAIIRPKPVEKKGSVWSKKNAGVLERAQKDFEEKKEEINVLDKSRQMLLAKSALYEKMTSGKDVPSEDGSGRFLVDFEKKTYEKIVEERDKERKANEETQKKVQEERVRQEELERQEELKALNEPIPTAQCPEEEWVDYTDSLGRSRRCLKQDLPKLKAMDKQLNPNKSSKIQENHISEVSPDLMSQDMYREKLREKWEQEEREALERPVGPTHYANVQYDEVRSHGVGYYQFSRENSAREEELKTLGDLREKTKVQRNKREELKAKRKAILDARLNKVKQRKLVREGGPGILEQIRQDAEKEEEVKDAEDVIGPKVEDMLRQARLEAELKEKSLERDDRWKRDKPMREWDKGKKELFKREDEKSQDDRPNEFAPPAIYFTDSHENKSQTSMNFAPPQEYHPNKRQKKKTELNNKPNIPMWRQKDMVDQYENPDLKINNGRHDIIRSSRPAGAETSIGGDLKLQDIPLPKAKETQSKASISDQQQSHPDNQNILQYSHYGNSNTPCHNPNINNAPDQQYNISNLQHNEGGASSEEQRYFHYYNNNPALGNQGMNLHQTLINNETSLNNTEMLTDNSHIQMPSQTDVLFMQPPPPISSQNIFQNATVSAKFIPNDPHKVTTKAPQIIRSQDPSDVTMKVRDKDGAWKVIPDELPEPPTIGQTLYSAQRPIHNPEQSPYNQPWSLQKSDYELKSPHVHKQKQSIPFLPPNIEKKSDGADAVKNVIPKERPDEAKEVNTQPAIVVSLRDNINDIPNEPKEQPTKTESSMSSSEKIQNFMKQFSK